jgi:hypothetical protein
MSSPPDAPPEVILATVDGLYVWKAPKPGMSLIGARIGRVVVTSRRFLFLSTGTSGLGKAMLMTAVGGPLLGFTLGRTRTDELDLGALSAEGSLDIPLERVVAARVARRWDFSNYLALDTQDTDGSARTFAFMTKLGRSRDELLAAQVAIDKARSDRASHPYRA